jgi:protein subunit release factor A
MGMVNYKFLCFPISVFYVPSHISKKKKYIVKGRAAEGKEEKTLMKQHDILFFYCRYSPYQGFQINAGKMQ